jgi:hypothetical protein
MRIHLSPPYEFTITEAGALKNKAKFILLWISLFCLQTVGVFISGDAEAWFNVLNAYLDISTAYFELQLRIPISASILEKVQENHTCCKMSGPMRELRPLQDAGGGVSAGLGRIHI